VIASSELINKSELPGFLKAIDNKVLEVLNNTNIGFNLPCFKSLSIVVYLVLATFVVFAREDFVNVHLIKLLVIISSFLTIC